MDPFGKLVTPRFLMEEAYIAALVCVIPELFINHIQTLVHRVFQELILRCIYVLVIYVSL